MTIWGIPGALFRPGCVAPGVRLCGVRTYASARTSDDALPGRKMTPGNAPNQGEWQGEWLGPFSALTALRPRSVVRHTDVCLRPHVGRRLARTENDSRECPKSRRVAGRVAWGLFRPERARLKQCFRGDHADPGLFPLNAARPSGLPAQRRKSAGFQRERQPDVRS